MLVNEYVSYLKGTEGKSTGTIIQYKSTIDLFFTYMKENRFNVTRETIGKIKVADIYGFINSITETNSNNSRRNKISGLKSFFEYCKEIEVVKHNVIIDIKKQPKQPKRIPKYFTIEECKHLIESISSRNTIRDRTIIITFLLTGFRLEELQNLNVSFINSQDTTIIGKGNKERNVCINPKLFAELKDYMLSRPKSDNKALFLSERGNRISKSAIQNIVRNSIEAAGLNPEHESDMLVHILRHSFASNIFQGGTDIRVIQDILGHKDISTTQIYANTSKKQIKDQAENSVMGNIF